MSWHTHDLGDRLNATSDSRYNGANVITLAIEALDRGFPTGEWFAAIRAFTHSAVV